MKQIDQLVESFHTTRQDMEYKENSQKIVSVIIHFVLIAALIGLQYLAIDLFKKEKVEGFDYAINWLIGGIVQLTTIISLITYFNSIIASFLGCISSTVGSKKISRLCAVLFILCGVIAISGIIVIIILTI